MTNSRTTTLRRAGATLAGVQSKLGTWGMTIALAVLAAVLRFWRLGYPHTLVFDETYYAKDAYSLLKFGIERNVVDDADAILDHGGLKFFTEGSSYVVHPPFGKWVIALGEAIFGMNPFGWRSMVAVIGVAAVVVAHRMMFTLGAGSFTAGVAGLAMAVDGMSIVMSRTALLDQTLMFMALLACWFGVIAYRSGRIWHRCAVAICLGLATATKWSGLWYAVVIIAALAFADLRAQQRSIIARLTRTAGRTVIMMVVFASTYLATWWGWFMSSDGWGRTRQTGVSWLPQPLRALFEYHRYNYDFHTHLTGEHTYAADPAGWLLMLRPTSFWYKSTESGLTGCGAKLCSAEVVALGNVIIWWTAVFAAITFLGMFLIGKLTRSERPTLLIPVVGVLAGWAPWLMYRERTTFTFYMIIVAPFICMLFAQFVTMIAGLSVDAGRHRATNRVSYRVTDRATVTTTTVDEGPSAGSEPGGEGLDRAEALVGDCVQAPTAVLTMTQALRERSWRAYAAVGLVIAAVAVSAFFYPVWAGLTLTQQAWGARMWFASWI